MWESDRKHLDRRPPPKKSLSGGHESESPEIRKASRELGEGEPISGLERARMEEGFGVRLEGIRICRDAGSSALLQRESAHALSLGNRIVLGPGQGEPGTLSRDLILAHEIAHSLQQEGPGSAMGERAAESGADAAAARVAMRSRGMGGPTGAASLVRGGGLALRRCTRGDMSRQIQQALDGTTAWTPSLAQQALNEYRSLSDGDRQRVFDRYYPRGAFNRLMQALPPGAASGPYNDVVQDILRRAQRAGVLESARAGGLTSETQMAQTQATFMHAQNTAAAAAALPTTVTAPTPAQVAAQQQVQVARTSITPATSTMTPAQEAACNSQVSAAVTTLVTYARTQHPELNLSAADFHADCRGIENRGLRVIAYASTIAGRRVAVVGDTFRQYVAANPAYAMSVVVHELRGHPEYGPYGVPGTEYALTLYDAAARLMPGYVQPTGPGRRSEIDAYAYQETEIYSLLRSYPYHTPLAPAHSALQSRYVDPAATVRARIAIIKNQWEPRLAKALLRGLYRRLRLDPRITPAALTAFEQAVRANYTGADASIANDILR